jgi:hypothetical protein
VDRIANNPLWFVFYTRLKVFGSENLKEIVFSHQHRIRRRNAAGSCGEMMGRSLQVMFLAAMCPVPPIVEWGEKPTIAMRVGGGDDIWLFLSGSPAGGLPLNRCDS